MADFIALAINGDGARAADIDHAQLTAFKIAYAQLFAYFAADRDGFGYRLNAADDDTVDVAVDHGVFVINEYLSTKNSLRSPWVSSVFACALWMLCLTSTFTSSQYFIQIAGNGADKKRSVLQYAHILSRLKHVFNLI
jgi:hypothetical protein